MTTVKEAAPRCRCGKHWYNEMFDFWMLDTAPPEQATIVSVKPHDTLECVRGLIVAKPKSRRPKRTYK
jgi:hypothetical protein